jgi:hypothetical protein
LLSLEPFATLDALELGRRNAAGSVDAVAVELSPFAFVGGAATATPRGELVVRVARLRGKVGERKVLAAASTVLLLGTSIAIRLRLVHRLPRFFSGEEFFSRRAGRVRFLKILKRPSPRPCPHHDEGETVAARPEEYTVTAGAPQPCASRSRLRPHFCSPPLASRTTGGQPSDPPSRHTRSSTAAALEPHVSGAGGRRYSAASSRWSSGCASSGSGSRSRGTDAGSRRPLLHRRRREPLVPASRGFGHLRHDSHSFRLEARREGYSPALPRSRRRLQEQKRRPRHRIRGPPNSSTQANAPCRTMRSGSW